MGIEFDKELEARTGIFLFENAISDKLCDQTIQEFEASKNKFNGKTGAGYKPGTKNSIDWVVEKDKPEIGQKYFSILEIAMKKIQKKYHYLSRYPYQWSGLQMQKSLKGEGFFRPHTDNDESHPVWSRWFAPIMYLNDVEEGGLTRFPMQGIDIKPKKGTLVIFPSTWQYWHEGTKPISGDKYIITTFGSIPRQF